MTQPVTLACPVCQTEAKRNIHTAINANTHPELKEQLIAGTLLNFECDTCGAKRHLEVETLYHDPNLKLVVFLAPKISEAREDTLNRLETLRAKLPVSLDDYRLRIVNRQADLIEKIQIFDEGFNDQSIELVKILTDGLFAKEKPEAVVKARYFYQHEATTKLLYITEDEQLFVDFHDSLLTFVEEKFAKALKEEYLGQFIVVNQGWALNLADKKSGPTANTDESDAE
ncbi:CpXC domain-containing protein [Fundicoccus sp. Sow4_D5]|uniref:CpXC domain-containing protein n=1 Tax=unclassified Fundicoccus TaxID=2761543 RepID=UPI003F8F5E24